MNNWQLLTTVSPYTTFRSVIFLIYVYDSLILSLAYLSALFPYVSQLSMVSRKWQERLRVKIEKCPLMSDWNFATKWERLSLPVSQSNFLRNGSFSKLTKNSEKRNTFSVILILSRFFEWRKIEMKWRNVLVGTFRYEICLSFSQTWDKNVFVCVHLTDQTDKEVEKRTISFDKS